MASSSDLDAPLDPRKSVFFQRYQRSLFAAAKQAAQTGVGDVVSDASKSIRGQFAKMRRGQIVSKPNDTDVVNMKQLKRFKKTPDDVEFLKSALLKNFLFKSIKAEGDGSGGVSPLQHCIDCMSPQDFEAGSSIITQGEFSDNMCFYVLHTGKATAFVNDKPVMPYEAGSSFGELALMYNTPRAATVKATEKCKLWSIDLKTFKSIQATMAMGSEMATCEFLKKCGFLDALNNEMITKLAGVVEKREFQNGEFIIRQGEWFSESNDAVPAGGVDPALRTREQEFYIIREGHVKCTQMKASGKEVTLLTLEPGQHFGEMALLTDEPRRASCIAEGHVRALCLSRQNFKLLLGPINVVLEQRMRIRILQSVPILQSIPEANLLLMSQAMTLETYKDGDYIIRQGEPGNAFYIIHEGHVKCSTFDGKKEVELVRLEPSEFFGERALVKNEPRKANVVAIGDVECLVLTKEQYKEYMSKEVQERLANREYNSTSDAPGSAAGSAAVINHAEELVPKPLTNYRFDELQIKRTLGTGTFGRVKLTQGKKDSKVYALKCMRKKDVVDKHQDGNVINEKNLLFLCSSCPFILKLYQTFNMANNIYMLMEFVQGGELWSYIYDAKRGHLLPRNPLGGFLLDAVKFYASNVVLALEHMHERNIAYRDLKPENLLLDHLGYIKVIDFGFAKKIPFVSRDGNLNNKTYTMCGTPEYLAPEIVTSKGYDKSVDCWALGCLLYELHHQRTPFTEQGDSSAVTFRKIVESEAVLKDDRLFPSPHEPNLSGLVKKMLHMNPSLRLGNTSGGLAVIRDEPLFAGFDWDAVVAHTAPAPFRPPVKHILDVQNFEQWPEDDEDVVFKGDQSKFQLF